MPKSASIDRKALHFNITHTDDVTEAEALDAIRVIRGVRAAHMIGIVAGKTRTIQVSLATDIPERHALVLIERTRVRRKKAIEAVEPVGVL